MWNKLLIIIILSCFHSFQTYSQEFSREQTIDDLEALIAGIQNYNPALYNYNPDFDAKTNVVIESIEQDSYSPLEYFVLVSKISALSNEGHFSLGNWEDIVHRGFNDNKYAYIPFSVRITQGKIYVWNDYSNEQTLVKGLEIESINGISSTEILEKLYAVTPSDGVITTYKDRTLELSFPWKYYLYVEQPGEFKIGVPDSEPKIINAILREQQVENYQKYIASQGSSDETKKEGFYTLENKEGYSVLTLPSFDYRRVEANNVKSKKMYSEIFSEISETGNSNLIIDLRNNTGGRNEFADDLIAFVNKKETGSSIMKQTKSWEGKEKTYKIPSTSKNAFTGKIYVLVNGRTYSAGSTLARYLKEFGDAVIIGEETGTRYEGFAAGSSQTIILPNSQITVGIPRYHIWYPESEIQATENRGLMPDETIEYTIEDLISGNDLVMERALELIRN